LIAGVNGLPPGPAPGGNRGEPAPPVPAAGPRGRPPAAHPRSPPRARRGPPRPPPTPRPPPPPRRPPAPAARPAPRHAPPRRPRRGRVAAQRHRLAGQPVPDPGPAAWPAEHGPAVERVLGP